MSKDDGAFRTIGELSKELGIKSHILRYWEDQFAMLQPLKRAGSRRHYRPEDVDMVKAINRLLNEEGYTIKGARKYLASQKSGASQSGGLEQLQQSRSFPASVISTSINTNSDADAIVAELTQLRKRLVHALAAA